MIYNNQNVISEDDHAFAVIFWRYIVDIVILRHNAD